MERPVYVTYKDDLFYLRSGSSTSDEHKNTLTHLLKITRCVSQH